MGYSKFKFRAEVDWLSFVIETASKTNAWTIRDAMKLPNYVTGLNEVPGGAATFFEITLQDVKRPSDVQTWINENLAKQFQLGPLPPFITGVEVSLDAYSDGPSRDDLIDLTTNFYKFADVKVSNNHRFSGRWEGDVEPTDTRRYIRSMIAKGRVINIGNASDEKSQRVYFKTTDDGGAPLPVHKHRARMEITLRGGAVPFFTLAEISDYKFTDLKPYFTYRRIKDGLTPERATAKEQAPVIRTRGEIRRKTDRSKRVHDEATLADTPLNDEAYEALRNLTNRMKGQPAKRCDLGGNSGVFNSADFENTLTNNELQPNPYAALETTLSTVTTAPIPAPGHPQYATRKSAQVAARHALRALRAAMCAPLQSARL